MGLLKWIVDTTGLGHEKRIRAWATAVADESQALIWQRVAQRSLGMRPAEARGYIRARAVEYIEPRIDTVLRFERASLEAKVREQLLMETLDQAVRLVHRQWVQARTQGRSVRRAA